MASYGPDAKDDDIISEARDAFKDARDAEDENRTRYAEDVRFGRMGQQWPDEIIRQRQEQGRPILTIPRLQTFIRQVVNDSRQNKPSIKTHPVDSEADPDTAELFNGIIRHIEYNSSADIAYDTAIDNAVSGGFGYWRIGLNYAHDDTFDTELSIMPVSDPLTVYGDPWAESFDGSDWMSGFVTEKVPIKKFERDYPDAEQINWDSDEAGLADWRGQDWMQVAEYWTREEAVREILKLSDDSVIDVERLEDEEFQQELYMKGVIPAEASTRKVPTWRVKQCILTGVEVLEKRDWPGKFIPIVPVYGDVVVDKGDRQLYSLIHFAKDAQRQLNYQRTASVEILAKAPRIPYIGPEKAFTVDPEKWATANTEAWSYLAYGGDVPPQLQQMDVSAYGAMQAAMSANEDMKNVLGQFDASLGAQGNETSGKAIIARQREGDTATFHFIDNLTRSIRHSGRILIDLIPHVWPDERVVRLMGEDGSVSEQKVNGPSPVMDKQTGEPVMEDDPSQMAPPGMQAPQRPKMRTFSLTSGKYDLAATAGPSYTTKRQEAAEQMMQLIQAVPSAAPLIGDLLVRNLDWPGADDIADRLEKMLPEQVNSAIPPQLQQAIVEGKAMIDKLQRENEVLKSENKLTQLKAQLAETVAKMAKSQGDSELNLEKMKLMEEIGAERERLSIERAELNKDTTIETRKVDIEEARLALEAADRDIEFEKLRVDKQVKMSEGIKGKMPKLPPREPSLVESQMIQLLQQVSAQQAELIEWQKAPAVISRDETGRVQSAKKMLNGSGRLN